MEVNFKMSLQEKSHIISFNIDCEYYDSMPCDNWIPRLRGLMTFLATDVTWYDFVWHCFVLPMTSVPISKDLADHKLRWHHNGHDGVSNHQPNHCLLNRLFRRRSKKTSKLRVIGLCVGNSPGPVNSPHKWPVTRKMFPFDDVIMSESLNADGHHKQ